MKITRNKKSHKTLMFFTTHFNYHEPYQVLIDATFCQAALKVNFLQNSGNCQLNSQFLFLTE